MIGRVKTNFDRSTLDSIPRTDSLGYLQEANSLYEITVLGEVYTDYILVNTINGTEVAYVHDICFDYLYGSIYFPLVTYEYFNIDEKEHCNYTKSKAFEKVNDFKLLHNQKVRKVEIWNSKQGYMIPSLTILHNTIEGYKKYIINLEELPIRNDIKEDDISVLMDKYIKYQYNNMDTDKVYEYYPLEYNKLSKSEKRLLEKYNLNWYKDTEFTQEFKYKSVRTYDNLILESIFTDEELDIFTSSHIKKKDFESYLLCHLHEHIYWDNFNLTNVLEGRWYFAKYKYRDIAFIFKSEWLKSYK